MTFKTNEYKQLNFNKGCIISPFKRTANKTENNIYNKVINKVIRHKTLGF